MAPVDVSWHSGLRESVRRLAETLDYPEASVHLTLALNALLRRLDELEARIAELEAR